jgi:Fe-S-cluster-containing dehydrogenase component
MSDNRRDFLKRIGLAGLGVSALDLANGQAMASRATAPTGDGMGVLVDIPQCVGCRKCEFACREAAGFDVPPIETFEDKSVFAEHRRPTPSCYTTVNRFPNPADAATPVYTKANCLHCLDPACVSACLVGALTKEANGAVTYDAWKCMGCRYCMVACPFGIPTYDYDNALTPQVRKCTMCFEKISKEGGVPACVKICPQECLTFGKRSDLLELAGERIRRQPDVYINHVYGEHEAGGTSWLYLAGQPFDDLGFITLGPNAPPRLTEAIQHGIFKYWMPPLALYGLLGAIMWLTKPHRRQAERPDEGEELPGQADRRATRNETPPAAIPVAYAVATHGETT